MNITIHFSNDPRTIQIPVDIIHKYQYCPINLFHQHDSSEKIMLTDITFEQFEKIILALVNNANYSRLPADIIELMKHYGLINDIIYGFDLYQARQRNEFVSLMAKPGQFLYMNLEKYVEYMEVIMNNPTNISVDVVPIQVIYFAKKIAIVCINYGMPIYADFKKKKYIPIGKYSNHEGLLKMIAKPMIKYTPKNERELYTKRIHNLNTFVIAPNLTEHMKISMTCMCENIINVDEYITKGNRCRFSGPYLYRNEIKSTVTTKHHNMVNHIDISKETAIPLKSYCGYHIAQYNIHAYLGFASI